MYVRRQKKKLRERRKMEENKKTLTKNLTEGSPMKLILGFALPMLFGLLFQQFYNLVDTMIVGKYLGVDALAGVGATGSINFLIIGFCMGVCSGFAIPVAQQFGANNMRKLRMYVANSAYLCILIATIVTTLSVVFCEPILRLMNTPSDIFEYSKEYIIVIFAGIPVIFLYNILSGIIRSMGDGKTPVVFLVISAILNIAFDIIFIVNFKLGIAGAAYATVLSQAISGIACLIFMIKKLPELKIRGDEWKPRTECIVMLCSMGIPMGLQYSITAIGSVIVQTSVNTLGSDYVAAVTAASKLSMLFACPFDALGATMATYGGQNVGAGKLDRLSMGLLSASILGAIYSVLAFAVLTLFGKQLGLLFLDAEEEEILANMHRFLIVHSALYIPLALVNIVRFCIQGMGFSVFAILAGVFEMIARSAVGKFAVPVWGFNAVCCANPAAWLLADAFLIPAFFRCLHKLQRTTERSKVNLANNKALEAKNISAANN